MKVQRPVPEETELLETGTTLIALMSPATAAELLERLAGRGVTTFAMELVPRTTKAQSMDALSSQATVAGYNT